LPERTPAATAKGKYAFAVRIILQQIGAGTGFTWNNKAAFSCGANPDLARACFDWRQ